VTPLILAILQARMSSTRLPGKVMMPLAGAPMVLRQIERVRRARRIDSLVIAVSDEASDDILAETAEGAGVAVFRGSLNDVLARYAGALEAHGPAEHVLRLTGDCPLADWTVIDAVIERHLQTGADYTANTWGRRTFPKGLDADVVKAEVLRQAAMEARDPYEREHVLPFVYRRPERYRLEGLHQAAEEGEVRWTVDLPADYGFMAQVYDALYARGPAFTSDDVRALVRGRPDLARLGGERRV
jgi:spore coat polysaccharide biosynthesis protein SpsF